MSEWDGTEELERVLREKGIVVRERTPPELMLLAAYRYQLGASLRRVRDDLEDHVRRSHMAVWKWLQKLGGALRERLFRLNGPLPGVLVLDETRVHVGGHEAYLWVALDPKDRAVVYMGLSQVRNLLVALSFLRAIRRAYGHYPAKVLTDGGNWYAYACRRLGIQHEVISGGVRSYLERWNETFKDRSRPFDKYHPCGRPRCDLAHVWNWSALLCLYYNHVRPHLAHGKGPPLTQGDEGQVTNRQLFSQRYLMTLS